jgi:hypothetical protein
MVRSSRKRRIRSDLLRRLAPRLFVALTCSFCRLHPECLAVQYPMLQVRLSCFADFQADERLRRDERFWTRFWGKEYGGVHLPLRHRCTKCGANFI